MSRSMRLPANMGRNSGNQAFPTNYRRHQGCGFSLIVEIGRLFQLRITVEVVLYPKLRACLLQKCVDYHSTCTGLLGIELEGWHAVQHALFWIVIEIARQHDGPGLRFLHSDPSVTVYEPAAELVVEAGTLVPNSAMRLGHQNGSLAAAVARPFAARKPALGATQVPLLSPRFSCRGLSISVPSERTAKLFSPTSTPMCSDDSYRYPNH